MNGMRWATIFKGCLCASLILIVLILVIWWLLGRREKEAPSGRRGGASALPDRPPEAGAAVEPEAVAVEAESFVAEAAGGETTSGGWESIQGDAEPLGGRESLDEAESFAAEAEEVPAKPDDLTRIEGIGPKIAGLLQEAGITTFAQLAATDVEALRQILARAGRRFAMASPEAWPEQAELAAKGAWEALKALQDQLKGGRRR